MFNKKTRGGRKPRDLVLSTWKKFLNFCLHLLGHVDCHCPWKTKPSNGPGTTRWSPGHLNEFYALVVYNPNSILAMKRMLGDLVTHPTCFLQLAMARQVVKHLWKPKRISPRMPRDRWWRGKKNPWVVVGLTWIFQQKQPNNVFWCVFVLCNCLDILHPRKDLKKRPKTRRKKGTPAPSTEKH